MNKKQFEDFMTGIGVFAEMALIFYRSLLEAGGTQEEAIRLTQALIPSMIFGGNNQTKPEG